MNKTFKAIKEAEEETERLLTRFADAIGCRMSSCSTPDGWDIEAYISTKDMSEHLFCAYGWCVPVAYDELLKIVMSSYGWNDVYEMRVWLDMHEVSQ